MRTRQLRQLYTQGLPFLAVYNDHIRYGGVVVKASDDISIIDATVFGPGYKGFTSENMHIEMLKNGVYAETHIGLDKDEIMLN